MTITMTDPVQNLHFEEPIELRLDAPVALSRTLISLLPAQRRADEYPTACGQSLIDQVAAIPGVLFVYFDTADRNGLIIEVHPNRAIQVDDILEQVRASLCDRYRSLREEDTLLTF